MTDKATKEILKWYMFGHTGTSSETMAAVYLGYKPKYTHHNYPHDPADLNRCIKLLESCPEVRESFPRIAEISPRWGAIIKEWDAVVSMFHEEAGEDWCKSKSAPKTYARMKAIYSKFDPVPGELCVVIGD